MTWLRPLHSEAGPIYRQVAQQVIKAVELGVLKAGDRLPAQRDLALQLGVDLTTITRAYAEIRQYGLLEAYGSVGSYISSGRSVLNAQVDSLDLEMNIPPLQNHDLLFDMMRSAQQSVWDRTIVNGLMNYQHDSSATADQEAGATWLEPALGKISPNRLIVCPGAQIALTVLLLTQSRTGDIILTDALTYPGMLASARTLGRKIIPIDGDNEGMRPAALAEACAKRRPAFVYLTPTIHNPTTITMSQRRREEIYAVACRFHIPIVEDDPHWLLAGDAPAPIATLPRTGQDAPVFYISTLSKCLAPGLRTAYLVMPPYEDIAPVLDTLRSLLQAPAAWMTAVATHLIQTGNAYRLLTLIRSELAARQRLANEFLPDTSSAHLCGLHRWIPLPAPLTSQQLLQLASARDLGLGMLEAAAFCASDAPSAAIRISLGRPKDRNELVAALQQLATLLKKKPAQASLMGT